MNHSHRFLALNRRAAAVQAPVQRGFTLIEMLVVMVIIGLLAGIVGPRIWGKLDTSKVQAAQAQIKMLESAVNIMRLDLGSLPANDVGLNLLVQAPTDPALKSKWNGPYLNGDGKVPVDPWGKPYQYSLAPTRGEGFVVYSFGQDGKPGGTGLDADVGVTP